MKSIALIVLSIDKTTYVVYRWVKDVHGMKSNKT